MPRGERLRGCKGTELDTVFAYSEHGFCSAKITAAHTTRSPSRETKLLESLSKK